MTAANISLICVILLESAVAEWLSLFDAVGCHSFVCVGSSPVRGLNFSIPHSSGKLEVMTVSVINRTILVVSGIIHITCYYMQFKNLLLLLHYVGNCTIEINQIVSIMNELSNSRKMD